MRRAWPWTCSYDGGRIDLGSKPSTLASPEHVGPRRAPPGVERTEERSGGRRRIGGPAVRRGARVDRPALVAVRGEALDARVRRDAAGLQERRVQLEQDRAVPLRRQSRAHAV